MKTEQLKQVNKVYEAVRDRFDAEQVYALSSLLYGLQKKHEERQRIISMNRELDVFNRKCAWKPDFKPVEMLNIPEL